MFIRSLAFLVVVAADTGETAVGPRFRAAAQHRGRSDRRGNKKPGPAVAGNHAARVSGRIPGHRLQVR